MAEKTSDAARGAARGGKHGSPAASLERWRVLRHLIVSVTGVLVSVLSTLASLEVVGRVFREPLIIGIVGLAIAILVLFTFVAERERAGQRPLTTVTEAVTNAFLAGLDASLLNPRLQREGSHE